MDIQLSDRLESSSCSMLSEASSRQWLPGWLRIDGILACPELPAVRAVLCLQRGTGVFRQGSHTSTEGMALSLNGSVPIVRGIATAVQCSGYLLHDAEEGRARCSVWIRRKGAGARFNMQAACHGIPGGIRQETRDTSPPRRKHALRLVGGG